jgi:very-short-patch-repair endonuclease
MDSASRWDVARFPRRDAGELDWLIFEQSGILTSAQACRLLGRGVVRTRLEHERWRSICRGVLSTHNGRLTRRQQLWVTVLVAGTGACLAGGTAATEGGVGGLRTDVLQVVIPATRGRSSRLPRLPPDMPPVHLYRTAVLPPDHHQVGSPPRTTIGRSVIDAAAWSPGDDEARSTIAAACQQRRVHPAELREVLTMFPRIRRHRLIATTISDLEGGAESLSEIDFSRLCRRYRLPEPDRQQRRADAEGRIRFIDAYWARWRLQVEVDGAHHMEVRHWAADMLRQNQLWLDGERILRFPAWLIRSDPAAVAAQLRTALTPALPD